MSEHSKKEKILWGYELDIVYILQEKVDELLKERWSDDDCPPEFWVSLRNEDMNNQQLILTVDHCGRKFAEVLFPRKDTEYGYDSLLNQMINMYNQTM